MGYGFSRQGKPGVCRSITTKSFCSNAIIAYGSWSSESKGSWGRSVRVEGDRDALTPVL